MKPRTTVEVSRYHRPDSGEQEATAANTDAQELDTAPTEPEEPEVSVKRGESTP